MQIVAQLGGGGGSVAPPNNQALGCPHHYMVLRNQTIWADIRLQGFLFLLQHVFMIIRIQTIGLLPCSWCSKIVFKKVLLPCL